MREFFSLLLGTIELRPYVFVSVAIFLFCAKRELGWLRALAWLVIGFTIAYASEICSIRTGFPYGWYYYVKLPTAHKELWLGDVPFMDSLSYTFLSYWAFSAARVLTGERVFSGGRVFPVRTWIVGSGLMMLSDVVIDPLAVRGHLYFLGRMFGYPEWGPYFGVPWSNFGGWFLVALAILGSMFVLEMTVFRRRALPAMKVEPFSSLLFISMMLFNMGIAVYLKEWKLLTIDLLIMGPIFTALVMRLMKQETLRSAALADLSGGLSPSR